MEVEVLRHWKRDDEEYGEYYVHGALSGSYEDCEKIGGERG